MYKANVYKIIFNKPESEILNNISYIDRNIIRNIFTCPFIKIRGINHGYFIINTTSEIEKYLDILKSNNIEYKIINISNDILKYSYDIESLITNSSYPDCFMEDLDNWIRINISIDTLVTKVNKVGINNLRKVEKDFLKKYSDL